jgi:hypothetical protein
VLFRSRTQQLIDSYQARVWYRSCSDLTAAGVAKRGPTKVKESI